MTVMAHVHEVKDDTPNPPYLVGNEAPCGRYDGGCSLARLGL